MFPRCMSHPHVCSEVKESRFRKMTYSSSQSLRTYLQISIEQFNASYRILDLDAAYPQTQLIPYLAGFPRPQSTKPRLAYMLSPCMQVHIHASYFSPHTQKPKISQETPSTNGRLGCRYVHMYMLLPKTNTKHARRSHFLPLAAPIGLYACVNTPTRYISFSAENRKQCNAMQCNAMQQISELGGFPSYDSNRSSINQQHPI
jgi:hypothetical protein